MRLSILDQSPIISGHTPQEAIQQTIRLAQAAEKLGYHRYWLAEHHSLTAMSSSASDAACRASSRSRTAITGSNDTRLRSYELLAGAFELCQRP